MNSYSPTVSQHLIWLDQMISGNAAKYNIGGYACLDGVLQYDIFNEAIKGVLQSQEVYSSIFSEDKGSLTCMVKDAASGYLIKRLDFSQAANPVASAISWMEVDFIREFYIYDQYLFSFALLKINTEQHFWYAKIHHLIGDGWSFRLLLNQAAELYTTFNNGDTVTLPAYKYSDYAIEDLAYYQSQLAKDDKYYWLNEYSVLPPMLFKKIYKEKGMEAGARILKINKELKLNLQRVADTNKVSLFHLILGLLVIYFGRTTEQSVIAIGVPVLNRTRKVYRNTAGMFMNLLCLQFTINEDDLLSSVLTKVKQKMSATLRHQRYEYGNLVRDLNLQQENRSLYNIRFSYENFDFTTSFGDLSASAIALSNRAETDQLAIYVREYDRLGFDIRFVYNPAYFSDTRVQLIAESLKQMMNNLTNDADVPVASIHLLTNREVEAVRFCSIGGEKKWTSCFINKWLDNMPLYSQRTAISSNGNNFTYEEINKQAMALVRTIHRYSVSGPVGLLLPRSEKMIVGMLAVMILGIPYVPVDPDYPQERIQYIIEDSACNLVICTVEMKEKYNFGNAVTVIVIEECNSLTEDIQIVSSVLINPDAPCYILYTSGSTGNPKGVVISSKSLMGYVNSFCDYFEISKEDVVIQQASFSFDTSVEEIFPVLSSGGRLHIVRNNKDLFEVRNAIYEQCATILSTHPWMVSLLNNEPPPPSLRVLISGGDVLMKEHVNYLLTSDLAIYNTYGPTESTVCVSYYKVKSDDDIIPIGKPIINREIYILNDFQQLVPFETEGEIYIGGEGLAGGYLNRHTLTEESFLPHPFKEDKLIYRSGDKGILLTDGNFIYRGRKDSQVSYRGYRIDTQEIEYILYEQSGIETCVVDVKMMNELPVLASFIKYKKSHQVTAQELRSLLSKRLPDYMIPQVWISVDQFLLLPNGKINRNGLPAIEPAMVYDKKIIAALPESGTELVIYEIWKEVLKSDTFGIDDSFFESGGHSLNIVQLVRLIRERLGIVIKMHDVFERDTVRKQAAYKYEAVPVVVREQQFEQRENNFVLTNAQRRIWILSQLEGASEAYHISGVLQLEGEVNDNWVEDIVLMLIERHDTLRTVFYEDGFGSVRQKVISLNMLKNKFYEEVFLPDAGEQEIDVAIQEITARPFDLSKAPLLRIVLIRNNRYKHLLVYVLHHIISDGWSIQVLLNEFTKIYTSLLNGEKKILSPLQTQFKHYIEEINGLDGSYAVEEEAYWLQKMSGKLPIIDMPTQFPRPAVKTYKGKEIVKHFSHNKLSRFCKQEDTTLFMGLLAILNVLVYRYTGIEDTIIGTPIVNRNEPGAEEQIGLFLNMLPVRTTFDGQSSFQTLLQLQKKELLQAYKFQHYPMDKLIDKLNYRSDPSRSPLFDILIVLHNQITMEFDVGTESQALIPGVSVKPFEFFTRNVSQFDISFAFFTQKQQIKLRVEYNTELFEPWFVDQLVDHYISLVTQLVNYPDKPVSHVEYFPSAGLLATYTNVSPHLIRYENLEEYVMVGAAQHSQNIAIMCGDTEITYENLERLIEKVCFFLQIAKGVLDGDRVAVLMTPSEWLPAFILGIWRAGAIYIPVNPSYPLSRRQMIIEDAGCKVVLTADDVSAISSYKIHPKDVPRIKHETAYILFTSGTTGKPKGVAISHAALVSKLLAEQDHIRIEGPVHSCTITNYCFDVFFLELFLPLLTGGKVVIPEPMVILEFEQLAELMIIQQVNVLHGTPTFLESFFNYLPEDILVRLNNQLKLICSGGESLYSKLVNQLHKKLPDVQLNNHYGPTEAVIHASVKENITAFNRNIIGRPMRGVRAYVLDKAMQFVPPGVIGELYIGGARAIANGYVNRKEENMEKFLPDPFLQEERMYRTGDFVKWTSNFELEFSGRKDDQVKIRGMRIELDEIKRLLESFAMVSQAVVDCFGEGDNSILVAFIAVRSKVDDRLLKTYLQKQLPDYMIPVILQQVNYIPLNENGKADKETLMLQLDLSRSGLDNVDPKTETELQVAAIWKDLLGCACVSINDHFFDIGGNSMLLIKMRMELKKKLEIHVEIGELVKLLTIARLAEMIDTLHWHRKGVANDNSLELEKFSI